MSEWRDAFGVLVESGDLVLSSSTSGGMVKIGTADPQPGDLNEMMRPKLVARWGRVRDTFAGRSAVGVNVVVLRKSDGSVPAHLADVIRAVSPDSD